MAPLYSQVPCIFMSQSFIPVINYLFPCLAPPAAGESPESRHQV